MSLVVGNIAHAQEMPDTSGDWVGLVTVPLANDLQVEYHLEQRGASLSGYAISRNVNDKDSAKFTVAGTIMDNAIELKGKSFVYKSGVACLSVIKLTYSREQGVERLTGKWSGDWSMSTCPPGLSGQVNLRKVERAPAERMVAQSTQYHATDMYGESLLDELKKRKYYALLIGINDYSAEGINDLDQPVNDVAELKKVLQATYTFDASDIVTLKNPTRDDIIVAFDDLTNKITTKDQLLIFYAGHGIWDEKLQQGYWLPADATQQSKARWLSNSTIRDYISGIHSKHTLLITDACFSGGIFKERSVTVANGRAIMEMYKLPSRKAMTSGTLTTVPDKSVFVRYLIKNLQTNDQPLLSTEDLFRNFKIAVINNSPNGQVPQYGTIGQTGDEGGDFIFLKR